MALTHDQLLQPKEVVMFNPETGEEETWSWLRFSMYVEEVGDQLCSEELITNEDQVGNP